MTHALNHETNLFTSGQLCETREEYFLALNKWVRDAQVWQSAMSYFTHVMSTHPEIIPNSLNYSNVGLSGGNAGAPSARPTFPWLTQPPHQTSFNHPEPPGGCQ